VRCRAPTAVQRTPPTRCLTSVPFSVSWRSHRDFPLTKNCPEKNKQALGEKLFGPTAESEQRKAEPIAPSASHEPTTVGRRSKRPDGSVSSLFYPSLQNRSLTSDANRINSFSFFPQDPFRAGGDSSESKPDDEPAHEQA